MRFYLFVILLFALNFHANAQAQSTIIEGTIKDSTNNKPLDYVSVYLESIDGKIIEFTNTDEKGYYTISFSNATDSLQVTANILGYRKKSFLIPNKVTELSIDFLLSPSSFELKEIIVRESSLPVINKNDTTTYHVAAYIDSTEYSVEDVLKKLPGVQVSEEGGISVNGKPIDKVLIEGDDMFGANYTIGTRNIRANVIDKVQVIDHFHDNPILKNVQESDRAVLNLSIKEEKKNIVSGTYTLGSGYGEELKFFLHTNLFSLSKKAKTFLLGNYNNNGFDAKGELIATFTDLDVNNQSIDDNLNQPFALLNLPNIQYIGLPEKFTNRRDLGLGSLSQIFNLSSSFKVKLTGTHTREDNEQQYFNQNRFFSLEDTIRFREESAFSNKNIFTDIVIQADYLPHNQKSSIKTFSNATIESNKVNLSLDRRENSLTEHIPQTIKERPTRISNTFEYTRKLGRNAASQIIFNHLYSKNQQRFNSRYNYAALFGTESSDSLFQSSNISQNISQIILRYLYNKKISFNLDIGYSWNTTEISSDATLLGNNEREDVSLSTNRINFKRASPLLNAVVKKRINIVDLSLGLKSSLESIENDLTDNSNFWLVVPFIQFKIPLTEDIYFRSIYQYRNELPVPNTLNNHFVFTDYQTINTGILDFNPIRQHRVISNLIYKDVLNSLYLNANFYYSNATNTLGSSFDFSTDIFNHLYFRPVFSKAFRGSFSAEKLFFDISSRFLFRYNYDVYNTQNSINGLEQNIKYTTNEVFVDYGSAFEMPVNFYITNSLVYTNTISSSIEEKSQLFTWKTKFRLLYKPSKYFHVDASWYGIYNKVASSFSNYLNSIEMNASYIFEKKKRRHEVSISIVNIPNKNQFIINSIDVYSQSQYGLEATPRFFLIKWDTSF